MVAMLVDSSSIDSEQHIAMDDVLKCNDFTREAIAICDNRMVDIPCMITLETEVPDTLTIHTNQKLLSNVMNELLYNAKKFTAKQAEEGKVLVRIQRDDSHVRWLIEDNGPGIAADNHEKIFTPFSKLDDFNEGLGLGLPLSRQTARLLGGELTLDTTFTTGSRFILEIPLTDF
jgi:signal transduction histidine kinase